jgi:hypothetical protein
MTETHNISVSVIHTNVSPNEVRRKGTTCEWVRTKGTTIEKIRKWERVGKHHFSEWVRTKPPRSRRLENGNEWMRGGIDNFFNRATRLVSEIFGLPVTQIRFARLRYTNFLLSACRQ